MASGFFGHYRCKLDAKGRVSVPLPVRSALTTVDNSFVVYRSLDRGHALLEGGDVTLRDKLAKALSGFALNHPSRQRLERHMLGSLTVLSIDGDGRTVLPDALRRLLKFGSEIVYVGRGEVFEVWDAAAWDAEMEANVLDDDDIAHFNAMWDKAHGPERASADTTQADPGTPEPREG